jgi:hypothetical protein
MIDSCLVVGFSYLWLFFRLIVESPHSLDRGLSSDWIPSLADSPNRPPVLFDLVTDNSNVVI